MKKYKITGSRCWAVNEDDSIDAEDTEVYLAADVDAEERKWVARIAELEKALREVGEHRCGECYECAVLIRKVIGL